jgi:hypothetical protein
MMPRSIRFTDTTSNFGWSAPFSVAIAQIADRAIVEGRRIFMKEDPNPWFPFFIFARLYIASASSGVGAG